MYVNTTIYMINIYLSILMQQKVQFSYGLQDAYYSEREVVLKAENTCAEGRNVVMTTVHKANSNRVYSLPIP